MPKKATQVMSLRLNPDTYRRLHAYGASKGISDSAAARELIVSGLAQDGLALYSTELGTYLRGIMTPLLEQLDSTLEARNAEQEDRIARVVSKSTKGSIIAAISSVELMKGMFEGLRDIPASDIYEKYSKQAGLVQAGYTLEEARERVGRNKE